MKEIKEYSITADTGTVFACRGPYEVHTGVRSFTPGIQFVVNGNKYKLTNEEAHELRECILNATVA